MADALKGMDLWVARFRRYNGIREELTPAEFNESVFDTRFKIVLRNPDAPWTLPLSLLPGLSDYDIMLYGRDDVIDLHDIPRHHPVLVSAMENGLLSQDEFKMKKLHLDWIHTYKINVHEEGESLSYCPFPDTGSKWCYMNGRVVDHTIESDYCDY